MDLREVGDAQYGDVDEEGEGYGEHDLKDREAAEGKEPVWMQI